MACRRLPAHPGLFPILCVIFAALVAGCAARRSVLPPIDLPPELPSASELLARVAAERGRVRGLRAQADSEIVGPDGTLRASEVLLVEPPDRLRIEVLSTFGVAWILATDGERLDIYSRPEETVYRGRPTRDLIAHYLPVPLAIDDLTDLLLGRPPALAITRARDVAWERDTGLVRLTLGLVDGGIATLWFDGRSGLLRRSEERDRDDVLRYDLRIAAHRVVGEHLLPSDLTILTPAAVSVRLAYANCDVNPRLAPELFRIPAVVGAREVRLNGDAAP